MKSKFALFLVVGFMAQALISLAPTTDAGLEVKSIVACNDCGKK